MTPTGLSVMHASNEEPEPERDTEDVDPFGSSLPEEVECVAYDREQDRDLSAKKWNPDVIELDKMREARVKARQVMDLQAKYLIAKELTASAKKRWETEAENLVAFLNESAEELPRFDVAKPQEPQKVRNPEHAWST